MKLLTPSETASMSPAPKPWRCLLSAAWPVLYRAQRESRRAREGLYARIRHPQYFGFSLIMTGFLLKRPTLLTLARSPVLVWVYARLSIAKERDSLSQFGDGYRRYMAEIPRFIPCRGRAAGIAGERT